MPLDMQCVLRYILVMEATNMNKQAHDILVYEHKDGGYELVALNQTGWRALGGINPLRLGERATNVVIQDAKLLGARIDWIREAR